MAQLEHDREDLLREATALAERAEVMVAALSAPVVIGFRRSGAPSVFFGADPVYQFNTEHQLRRAFVNGRLIKAERGRLVSLTRVRQEGQVQLLRHDLAANEADALLQSAAADLAALKHALAAGEFELIGQVPPDGDVVRKAIEFLGKLNMPLAVADSPQVS